MNNPTDSIKQTDFYVMTRQIKGEWIPNFEEGKIYSTVLNRYITPSVTGNGYAYLQVTILPGLRRAISLHRALLVMKTGIPVDPRLEADHINNDPSDNRICNLRWVTPSENTRNRPEKFSIAEAIRREKEAGATTRDLAEKYHYSPRMIRNIVANERYDPAKYPGTAVSPHLYYTLPTAGGAFMRWYQ